MAARKKILFQDTQRALNCLCTFRSVKFLPLSSLFSFVVLKIFETTSKHHYIAYFLHDSSKVFYIVIEFLVPLKSLMGSIRCVYL